MNIFENYAVVGRQRNKKCLKIKLTLMLIIFCITSITASINIGDGGVKSYSSDGISFSDNQGRSTQQQTITGIVTDPSGAPLPGVTIVLKGTTQGTVTDDSGRYSLSDVPLDATLIYSFVGLRTQEVNVGSQTVINVELEEETIGIEEVVAIGYGTRRIGELTGSVSSVKSRDLQDMPSTETSELLKGNISGITILDSHTPGEGASVLIRGLGTINDNSPLWVVDGVPGASVNPNNIESISVLKDASAQAIYGSRAANGVILVTTKSGRQNQKTQVNVRIKSGTTRNTNSYDLLNTQEYGELLWLMAKNDGITNYSHPQYGSGSKPDIPEYILPARATNVDLNLYDNLMTHIDGDDTYLIMKANKEGTDWFKEIQQTGVTQDITVDVTGGSTNSSYSFMASYLNEEGVFKWTGYKRYNIRSNLTFNVRDWLEIGERLELTHDNDWGGQSNFGEGSAISRAFRLQPIIPVYDVMGNFAGTQAPNTGNGTNPVFYLWSNQNDEYKSLGSTGNVYTTISPIQGLSLKSLFGYVYRSTNNRNIGINEVATAERGKYDSLSESASFGLQWNWSNTLEYTNTFANNHHVTIIAGTEAVEYIYQTRSASRNDYFSTDPNYMQLDAGVQSIQNSGNSTDWALFSVFGRLNYNFAEKYLLEATLRRDGSSRFGADHRYGNFPALSAGWRVTEENFMESTRNWLDFLKIRVGWGQTGNDRIGNYNGFTTFLSYYGRGWYRHEGSYYAIDGANTSATPGFQSDAFGDPNVKWEKTTTTNIGLDATLFNNFTLNLDVWKRKTEDMLFPKQIPQTVGLADAPSINVGTMENRGIDFQLGYNGSALNNDLQYNITFNISHYKNEIVNLSGNPNEFLQGGEVRNTYYTRAAEGTSFPEFYGYIVDGIFQTDEEAAAHPPAFGQAGTYNEPGHFIYRDVTKDGVINTDDRTYIGSPHPDFTSGLNFKIQYKDVGMAARFYSSYGNEMSNAVLKYIDFNLFQGNRSHKLLYESWGSPYLKDNKDAAMTMAQFNDVSSQEVSTHFIEDASYLRLESLELSYDFANLLNWKDFTGVRLFSQVTNLFTLTKYSGLDPEVNRTGIETGMDEGTWPTPRKLLFGLNISF